MGIIISSPELKPKDLIAINPAEPLETAIPNFLLTLFAIHFSNFFTKGPSLDIQPLSIHSCKYFNSLPERSGVFTESFYEINFIIFNRIKSFLSFSSTYGPCFISIISVSSSILNPCPPETNKIISPDFIIVLPNTDGFHYRNPL